MRGCPGFTDAQMNDLRKAFQRNKLDATDRTEIYPRNLEVQS